MPAGRPRHMRMRLWIAALALGTVTGSGFAGDGPRDDLALLESAARTSKVAAMAELAAGLLDGRWGSRDVSRAIILLRAAADKHDVRALRRLAELHDRGQHLPLDTGEAARLLLRAFSGGDAEDAIVEFESDAAIGNVWRAETLRALQRQLRDAGRYDRPIDGIIGTRSLQAIRAGKIAR